MEELITFILCFIGVYLLYFLLVINRKKTLEKYKNSTEVRYLKGRYNINTDKIDIKKLANIMTLSNAFIISTTVVIVGFVPNYILKLLVGFVILIPLILLVYHIVGIRLQKVYGIKKEGRK